MRSNTITNPLLVFFSFPKFLSSLQTCSWLLHIFFLFFVKPMDNSDEEWDEYAFILVHLSYQRISSVAHGYGPLPFCRFVFYLKPPPPTPVKDKLQS